MRNKVVGASALALCITALVNHTTAADLPRLQDWPRVESAVASDAAVESRVTEILAGMSLAEKIGQMTQAEIKSITPDEARQYHIGSVLNGGGSWPGMDKHAPVDAWVRLADEGTR